MARIDRNACLCLVFVLWTGTASAQWTATILPPPPGIPDDGDTGIFPALTSPINNKGQVAGSVRRLGMNDIPVLWTNGVPTVLPLPSGYHLFAMKAINDAGLVVGQIQADTAVGNASQPVVWNGMTPSIIPFYPFPVPNYYCDSTTITHPATWINNPIAVNRAGHVAGIMATDVCGMWGWIWDTSSSKFIYQLEYSPTCPTPTTAPVGITPFGINDADQVISNLALPNPITGLCENIQTSNGIPVLISPGKTPFLLPVPDHYSLTFNGNTLNNLDQTYGSADPYSPLAGTAFFWTGTSYVDAAIPPPGANFEAINNLGQALLYTGIYPDRHFYIWHNGKETEITLPPSVINLNTPAGINDAGQIASYAAVATGPRIVVLTRSGPCAIDISSYVTVTRGKFQLNPTTGHFTQVITLTNNAPKAIPVPISLVLDNLPDAVTLHDLSGVTSCATPAGSPLITTTSSLAANGGTASITLNFMAKTGITYTTRVLAGAGRR